MGVVRILDQKTVDEELVGSTQPGLREEAQREQSATPLTPLEQEGIYKGGSALMADL